MPKAVLRSPDQHQAARAMQSCAASQRAFLPTSPGVDNEDAGQERASQRTKSKPQTTKELLTESHKDSAETISPGF